MTGNAPDWDGKDPDLSSDDDMQKTPRRGRQPLLAVLAILAIVLLVLALAINGGI